MASTTATPIVATKKNLAFIDFEFVLLNHKDITKYLVKDCIIEGMMVYIIYIFFMIYTNI